MFVDGKFYSVFSLLFGFGLQLARGGDAAVPRFRRRLRILLAIGTLHAVLLWALSLPETEEAGDRFGFSVRNKGKLKGFVWVWMERIDPKKARVPQPRVVAVRTASLDDRDFLLAMDQKKFFTEPHYKGFPAALVRLPAITVRELRPIITEAWRCQAPKGLTA